ncbi:MAG: hypothetical protein LC798_10940 [Chloroflexi bacterium]|nr:hypothetical protein [Chloroflexota bacterium]
MNVAGWSPEEKAEFSELCDKAWVAADSTGERVAEFDRLLRDAEQAHRFYASDVAREARRLGLAVILKNWHKAHRRMAFAHNGQMLDRPRIVGTKITDEAGQMYDVQTLFDYLTWDQIEDKIVAYSRNVKTYRDNIALARKVLALRDLAPSAATPAEAASALGISLDDYLTENVA